MLSRRLGLCGENDTSDIANVLVERFGPQVGSALVRLDRILSQIEHGDEIARARANALRRSDSEWAPLDQELAFARAYLDVEQARFGPRIIRCGMRWI